MNEHPEPFQLHPELLGTSPDVAAAQAELPEAIKLAISAAHTNNRTTTDFLDRARRSEPTGDLEYHLQLVSETIDDLRQSEFAPQLTAFIQREEELLEKNKVETAQVVGNKKRGVDSRYE